MITDYANSLYNNLMLLVQEPNSPFMMIDHVTITDRFRVFNYRLASYSDFLKPDALECRGIMFYTDEHNNCRGLAALPPRKFFNYKENPMTMNLDLSQVDYIMDKMDGSLMTSYTSSDNVIKCKSKTALTSEQAIAANKLLSSDDYTTVQAFLHYMEREGYSVSMEYTSPDNRIVVGYQESALTILEARNLHDGTELNYKELYDIALDFNCSHQMVKIHDVHYPEQFIQSIAEMTGNIEGFVVRMKDGQKIKIKTDAYSALHHCKDSVTIPRRLYEVVVNEAHDDLRGMFATDQYVLDRINEYEALVKSIYINIDNIVNKFYNDNKHLDRKNFAIKGQAELPKMFFGVTMSLYLGKEVDWKEFLIKYYKEFGISDTKIEES